MTATITAPDLLVPDHHAASARTLKWRDEIALLLRGRGLGVGRPYGHDVGQLEGIPGWTVLVRRPQRRDLSAATRVASELAAEAGSDHHAVILHRRGHPNDGAYVVLGLGDFADLLLTA